MSTDVEKKTDYQLNVSDDPARDDATTVTLVMSRERALAMAYHLNKFLAEIPADAVRLPVNGVLLFD